MIPFSHSKTLVDLDEGIYSIDLVVLDVGEDMSAILDEWQAGSPCCALRKVQSATSRSLSQGWHYRVVLSDVGLGETETAAPPRNRCANDGCHGANMPSMQHDQCSEKDTQPLMA